MTRINLLPWREQRRKDQLNQLLRIGVLCAIFAGIVVGYAHFYMLGLIDDQHARNNFLKNEISAVEKQIEKIRDLEKTKNNLLARMSVIQQLQRDRPQVVRVFDEVVRVVPDGVHLDTATQIGGRMWLKGEAQSNAQVSILMRNIESSEWLTNPSLLVIEAKGAAKAGTVKYSSFNVALHLKKFGEVVVPTQQPSRGAPRGRR